MGVIKKIVNGISQIASPISTVINAWSTSRENEKNREWTEQQNELAWHRQNQLINEQRAYDTPKAQMARLMDAGLNPNLIYGDLGGNMQAQSAPNAAGSYAGVAPQVDPLAISQSLLNLANARKADTDVQNSTRLTDQTIKESFSKQQLNEEEVKKTKANIAMIEETSKQIIQQTENLNTLNEREKIGLSNDIVNLSIRSAYMDEEFEAYAAQLGLSVNEYKFACATLAARIAGVDINNNYLRSELRLNNDKANEIEKSLPFLESLYRAQSNQAILDAGIAAQNYKLNKSFMKADKLFGYGNAILNGASSVVSGVLGFKRAYSPVKAK